MIWIATLCLLTIAAWLFFNALNELDWVKAHSHDETVASDVGLFPTLTAFTRKAATQVTGKISIDQEKTRIANALAKVQNKSAKYSQQVLNSGPNTGQAARDPNGESFIDRTAKKIATTSENVSSRLVTTTRDKASNLVHGFSESRESGLVGKMVDKVSSKLPGTSNTLSDPPVNQRADNNHSDLGKSEDLINRVSDKVAPKIDKIEEKIVDRT